MERLAIAVQPLDELPGVGRVEWHEETSLDDLTCAAVGDRDSQSAEIAPGGKRSAQAPLQRSDLPS